MRIMDKWLTEVSINNDNKIKPDDAKITTPIMRNILIRSDLYEYKNYY